ncbi:hypothetical protein PM393_gp15 [Pseudomonas phage vB_PaeS-Yazdi-M]|uniref:Uncharacterized protein n=1 Tax=Pseudomonas phage vB_PaeS-Yazdi-M TaxID=2746928 RepID=A0A6S6MEB1_9CAUD|nr:hypothetical protein PM393_gp15 [Pseudomonas phage vB_PaeS-Yazdi-M]BCG66146.1 hypothetical protein [Pseudomonas phage vB_PaeS-Yazdi-M]
MVKFQIEDNAAPELAVTFADVTIKAHKLRKRLTGAACAFVQRMRCHRTKGDSLRPRKGLKYDFIRNRLRPVRINGECVHFLTIRAVAVRLPLPIRFR